jgi:hypothetical protein
METDDPSLNPTCQAAVEADELRLEKPPPSKYLLVAQDSVVRITQIGCAMPAGATT